MNTRVIAQQFALAAPPESITPFGSGLINETLLVATSAGDYVLQRINRAVFPDANAVMANIVTVYACLDGAFVPEPVRARDGEWLVMVADEAWRMWHRVPGDAVVEPTPARVRSAAQLLARFHAALADCDPAALTETIPGFHDPARRLVQLQEAIAADPCGRATGATAEIDAALESASLVALARDLEARTPAQVAHNDAQLPNFVFRGDDAVALLDLDTLMPGRQFWDLGDLLRTGSTPSPEDDREPERHRAEPALARAIIDGYGAADDAALAAGALVTYEQALRFLTDWLLGDVYYRTTRPEQNLDRARGQLTLLASLHGTVGA